ncbi:nicotinate-nucleotide adenylyltransferase [Vibrio xiamenensis]|uniref:nicotinate-nucleotide adenylyltransferase n=1 Tax=Vibrio xiamenensis TaxID=861298 RepID=A0A1G8ERH9_9VIBR|nr:nicotinate-nicotinamide nucleotide adenylyltransferase [Vibrio xiamenensis]SDH72485.1 nicotinate-nucleotide adenylyltransferase [Vibrio xiamenensis]
MLKIAVFGSAFNPPSLGHKSVIESLSHFDKVLLVPSISHAWGKEMLDYNKRCQLLDAFISDLDLHNIERSNVETELHVPGESVTTYSVLERIRQIWPKSDITFVIGPDNLLKFHKFAKCNEILSRYYVMACPEKVPVRSTEIRNRIETGASVDDLTTPSVAALLRQTDWYH